MLLNLLFVEHNKLIQIGLALEQLMGKVAKNQFIATPANEQKSTGKIASLVAEITRVILAPIYQEILAELLLLLRRPLVRKVACLAVFAQIFLIKNTGWVLACFLMGAFPPHLY